MRGLHDDLLFYTRIILYGLGLDGRRRLRRILTDGAGGRCGDSAGCFTGLQATTDCGNEKHAKQQECKFLWWQCFHKMYILVV